MLARRPAAQQVAGLARQSGPFLAVWLALSSGAKLATFAAGMARCGKSLAGRPAAGPNYALSETRPGMSPKFPVGIDNSLGRRDPRQRRQSRPLPHKQNLSNDRLKALFRPRYQASGDCISMHASLIGQLDSSGSKRSRAPSRNPIGDGSLRPAKVRRAIQRSLAGRQLNF